MLNLAVGPRNYLARDYLELLNGAEIVVIQMMSGRSNSNSLFDNSDSGGLFGCIHGEQPTTRAEEFLSRLGKTHSKSRVREIIDETLNDYLLSFVRLLRKIVARKILFWFSTHAPQYDENCENIPAGFLGGFPHLVNQNMVQQLAVFSDDYVECISTQGLPQALWSSAEPIDGTVSKARRPVRTVEAGGGISWVDIAG